MKNFVFGLINASSIAILLTGCSVDPQATVDDQTAEENGILSQDDAEVLIYEQLSAGEKEKYTVDFQKTEGTLYYIRVYEMIHGKLETQQIFTVDFNSKKVNSIERSNN